MKTVFQAIPLYIPKLVPVGLLLLGLILGFVWAYGLSPNVYTAAQPVNLGDSWKRDYIKQVAWQYSASSDKANATQELSYLGNAKDILDKMIQDPQLMADANLAPRLQALEPYAVNDQAQLGKITPGLLNSNLTPFLCIIGLALLVGVPLIINTLVPISVLFSRSTSSEPSTVVEGQEAKRREVARAIVAQKTDFPAAATDRGAPVAQFISTYLLNDDVYDDSFAIETPSGEFLGETGAGISKTLGNDKPKKVTALEFWVFDKNDIRTVTKVLMSQYAFNDPALRAELAGKGDAMLLTPGSTVLLETQTLTVQGRVVNLSYGTGNTPPNSFFDQLTLEIAAWPKAAGPNAVPVTYALPPESMPPPPPPDPYSSDTTRFSG